MFLSTAGRAMWLVEFNRAKCRESTMGGEASTLCRCVYGACYLRVIRLITTMPRIIHRHVDLCTRQQLDGRARRSQRLSSRARCITRPRSAVLHSVQSHALSEQQTDKSHTSRRRPARLPTHARTHCGRRK